MLTLPAGNLFMAGLLALSYALGAYIIVRFFAWLIPRTGHKWDQPIRRSVPIVAAIIVLTMAFSTYQAYGPRVSIKTRVTPQELIESGEIRDTAPSRPTDAERMEDQRRLDAETRERVSLPPDE